MVVLATQDLARLVQGLNISCNLSLPSAKLSPNKNKYT